MFRENALVAEIQRRQAMLEQLRVRHADLAQQLESLNAEIAEIESASGMAAFKPRRGRGRPKGSGKRKARGAPKGRGRGGNKNSLPVLRHSLLRGKTMSVPEMAAAAKKAGHKSKSKNFRTIVSLAIINNRKMFKRVSRGQYTAK